MLRWTVRSAAALRFAGLLFSVGQASAQVAYGNPLFSDPSAIDPVTGFAGAGWAGSEQDRSVRSDAGGAAALDVQHWGDSHNTRCLYCNLAHESAVSFTVNALPSFTGASLLNPGHSIISGAVRNVSHDGAYYAGQSTFASWSPFFGNNAIIAANGGAMNGTRGRTLFERQRHQGPLSRHHRHHDLHRPLRRQSRRAYDQRTIHPEPGLYTTKSQNRLLRGRRTDSGWRVAVSAAAWSAWPHSGDAALRGHRAATGERQGSWRDDTAGFSLHANGFVKERVA